MWKVKTQVIVGLVVAAALYSSPCRLEAASITSQGSTQYDVRPVGWNTDVGPGDVFIGAENTCCSNPEWVPFDLTGQDAWLFNGATNVDAKGTPTRKLWSASWSVAPGEKYDFALSSGSMTYRYPGKDDAPVLALMFDFVDAFGNAVSWESGHAPSVQSAWTTIVSSYEASKEGVLTAWIVDLNTMFEKNDGFFKTDLVKTANPEQPPVVPEPRTIVLLAGGLILLLMARRTFSPAR